MSEKTFKRTPYGVWVTVISVLLVAIYTLIAIWFLLLGSVTVDFGFYVIAFVCTIGVVYKKEWARQALIAISWVSLIYTLIDMVWLTRQANTLSVLFILMFLGVIFFYQQNFVRAEFQPVNLPRTQIHLIDDDKTLARMLTVNFLSKGMTLLVAETGEKGLILAKNKDVDLIILDVILPKMKGREVCQRLKEDSQTKDIPIIFLTVKDSPDDIQAELEAGAVSHLTKPVDFQQLYQQIKKILGL
jgi:CheY-like chemotaxis protein